jgi:hypothetical protein
MAFDMSHELSFLFFNARSPFYESKSLPNRDITTHDYAAGMSAYKYRCIIRLCNTWNVRLTNSEC